MPSSSESSETESSGSFDWESPSSWYESLPWKLLHRSHQNAAALRYLSWRLKLFDGEAEGDCIGVSSGGGRSLAAPITFWDLRLWFNSPRKSQFFIIFIKICLLLLFFIIKKRKKLKKFFAKQFQQAWNFICTIITANPIFHPYLIPIQYQSNSNPTFQEENAMKTIELQVFIHSHYITIIYDFSSIIHNYYDNRSIQIS